MPSHEEYLSIISEFLENLEEPWTPAEPEIEKPIPKDKINENLFKYKNFKIDNFLIKISNYNNGQFSFSLFEEIRNISRKVKTSKNGHFQHRDWLRYFHTDGMAKDMPTEKMHQLICWLRAINQLKSFI